MNELALFAGAGGGIIGGKLLGWRTVCAVEWGEYPASALCARQNDGVLPPFPIWDDVQTFDGKPWRGIVDVVSGGFPCQDISVAGKGAGITGERSGMWTHMARIIGEVRPRFAFVENSPALITRGLGVVLSDLAALGYDSRWGVLGASDVGANHQRDRLWIVANSRVNRCGIRQDEHISELRFKTSPHAGTDGKEGSLADSDSLRELQPQGGERNKRRRTCNCREVCNTECAGLEGFRIDAGQSPFTELGDSSWWEVEPDVDRVAHGVAARVDRLKAIGNGQVPLCAATAWRLLTKGA